MTRRLDWNFKIFAWVPERAFSGMANDGDCGFANAGRAAPHQLLGRAQAKGVTGQSPLPGQGRQCSKEPD